MDHRDHVRLLQGGVAEREVWADIGSGTGAFTLALAELLGSDGIIHSVDKDRHALRQQQQRLQQGFPDITVHFHLADYRQSLPLPSLDGIVIANALHFQRDKQPVLKSLWTYLRPGGKLIIVEYDTDHGNRWVPYPLRFESLRTLAATCGFGETRQLATVPSTFLDRFYAALNIKATDAAGTDPQS
jgi:ubiquinone/menaquinone biosynthesis C-methylase UbiE